MFPTFEAFHSIQLGKQLVDHSISDACRVMASLRSYCIKLIKEEDAGGCSRSLPAIEVQCN